MLRSTLVLVSFCLTLAWCCLRYGGVLPADWNVVLLGLGLILLVGYVPFGDGGTAAPVDGKLFAVAIAIPVWAAVQLVPLPVGLVAFLSPERAALAGLLLPGEAAVGWVPISIYPEATRRELLHLLGYLAAFLVARDLMWRFPRGQWRVAAPLLVLAVLEASLGLVQDAVNASTVIPSGTFVNRDHFSSFLEMALPFAAGGFVEYWSRRLRKPLLACALAGIAAVLLAGIAASLSRGGFLIALGSLAVLGAVQVFRRFRGTRRVLAFGLGGVSLFVAVAILASPQLLERFGGPTGIATMSLDERPRFWAESLEVAKAYPVTGAGFGTFASAVSKFRRTSPTRTLDFAHNDLLQLAGEAGLVGLALVGLGLALVFRRIWQAWFAGVRTELPLACAVALLAALAHSLFDFNLRIPACALACSWIAGMSAGLRFPRSVPTRRSSGTREVLSHFRHQDQR